VAARFSEALELGREEWLRGDLRRHTSGGTPLWDGKTRISIRGATLDAIASYASRSSETDPEDELGIVFIVELYVHLAFSCERNLLLFVRKTRTVQSDDC
jgi:hypothetical protein